MGKIHKALEKSRKEHQGKSRSGSSSSFNNRTVQKDGPGYGATEQKHSPALSTPVSSKVNLGEIHELLHDPLEPGVSRSREKNDKILKNVQDTSAPIKAPTVAFTDSERPNRLAKSYEEKPETDPRFSKDENHQVTRKSKLLQESRNHINADPTPLGPPPQNTNESLENHKISTSESSESIEKKVFVLSERALNESSREDSTEKMGIGTNDKTGLDNTASDSINYTPVNNSLVALLKPRSYEAEQFKILRTNILFPESGEPARSILITSAAPGDGKSFVSANLAVSLALDHDRKVLLIDADVRRAAIHNIFGLNGFEKGVCDFLADRVPLASLLVRTSLKNLFVLPAGQLTHDPAQLQSLEKLPKLFEELSANFAEYFVVIDSPPPKLAAETGVLARLVDRIVIVMKSGVTKREYIEETIELVDKGKIAGIVFNWHENRMSKYKKYAKNREYYS
jgi:capsular exopolysaccharide synthesis family protein